MLQQIFITSVRVGNICQWIYLSCHFGISKISPCAQKHSGGLITLSDFLLCLVPVSSRAGQQQQSSQNSLIVWLLIVSTTLHPPVSSLRQRWSQLMREHPSLHIRQTSNQPSLLQNSAILSSKADCPIFTLSVVVVVVVDVTINFASIKPSIMVKT